MRILCSDAKQRFYKLLAKLDRGSSSVWFSDTDWEPLTQFKVSRTAFDLLYDPSLGFSILANELAAWEEGNVTARLWADYGMAPFDWSPLDLDESLIMITVIDAERRSPVDDLKGFHLLFDEVNQSSVYVGPGYAISIPLVTTGSRLYLLRASSSLVSYLNLPTFHSLYSSSADLSPSTDLNKLRESQHQHPDCLPQSIRRPHHAHYHARHMSQYFEGSVVLEQNSPGHFVYDWHSNYTRMHLSNYFYDGTMPKEETVCQLDLERMTKFYIARPFKKTGR
jgi:hypothetical protein